MTKTQADRVRAIVGRRGLVTTAELRRQGIHHEQVRRLVSTGELVRIARGLHLAADADLGEHASLIQAAVAIPDGVICLLSALRYHGIGTQLPAETWIAIRRGRTMPRSVPAGLLIVKVSEPAFSDGVDAVRLHGHSLRITSPAKTVADCFKFRGRIGLDTALEALRDVLRRKLATRDAVWRHAQICRAGRIIRPYLEATT